MFVFRGFLFFDTDNFLNERGRCIIDLIIDIETYRSELSSEQKEYRESGITAPGNYKDPVKIAEAIAEKKRSLYDKDALDPMYGRIIAIGYMITDVDDVIVNPTVLINKDEQALLISFYQALMQLDEPSGSVYPITFNGTDFDIPFLNFRTMTHSITSHYRLQSLMENDIRNLLAQKTNIKQPEHSLDEYAMHFGINHFKNVKGADVGRLWEAGEYQAISDHCKSDVIVCFKLYQKARYYHLSKRY